MKNFLLAMCIALVSTVALAKGTLTLKPGMDVETGEHQILTGLSIYQPIPASYLGLKLGYNGWFGGEMYETNTKNNWVKIDNSIETYSGPMAFGVGGYINHQPYATESDTHVIYATMKMTLWN